MENLTVQIQSMLVSNIFLKRNFMKVSFIIVLSLLLLPHSIKAEDEVIKSKDLKNQELDPTAASGSDGNASITPAQAEDLKKQIETLKENQKKSQELLEELDKE